MTRCVGNTAFFLFIIAKSLKFVKKQFFSRALAREGYPAANWEKRKNGKWRQFISKGVKIKSEALGKKRMGRETKTEGGNREDGMRRPRNAFFFRRIKRRSA